MRKLRWNGACVLWNGEAFNCRMRLCCKTTHVGQMLNLSWDGDSGEEPPSRGALFWGRLKEELPELDLKTRVVPQDAFPGERIAALPLTELTPGQGEGYGAPSLGYDAGDTPAGRLHLFVAFDEAFQPVPEPICEACWGRTGGGRRSLSSDKALLEEKAGSGNEHRCRRTAR